MGKGRVIAVLLCLVTPLVLPAQVCAFWVENGKAVCLATENQNDPFVVPDDAGGSIIVWYDLRSGLETEVYAQRVDEHGRDMWTSDGVPVYSGLSSAAKICLASDGASGAFIAVLNGDNSLYVQRLYADGTTWSSPQGTLICSSVFPGFDIEYISMTSDRFGGVIVAWADGRAFPDNNIYAQRVNAAGAVKWAANGVPVCAAALFQMSPVCTPDMNGGAVIAWTDLRSGYRDIYAQRIDSTGTVLWTADGVPVCTETGDQQKSQIISCESGGAIIAWEDLRGTYTGLYLQKLDPAGVEQWTTNGVAATTDLYEQVTIRMVTDGAGGAIITWLDVRNTLLNTDIYAQRVDSDGDVLWETDGAAICTADEIQSYPEIAEDGAGGAVITWQDTRNSAYDMYAQRIGPDGVVMWEENGIAVCAGEAGIRFHYSIAFVGYRGVVIAWEDGRNGETDYNIYAQGLDLEGNWGYPSPVIHSVEDIPGDQGGFVSLFWYASLLEDPLYDEITYYTLWRAVEPQEAMAAVDLGAELIEDPADLDPTREDRVIRMTETQSMTYFWELVGTQQAYRFEAYARAIPTLFDSTAVYHAYHYFQVLAHISDQDYYVSGIDSAYSVDDLSPDTPEGLAGEQSYVPEGLQLSWDPNGEEDLMVYNIYRGASNEFIPGSGNRIASTSAAALFDDAWTWDSGYWYKVTAADIHGNESGFAVLGPNMITGDDTPVPYAACLSQNFPNPFNPATIIAYGLKEREHVSLRIYDTAGRLVSVLVDQEQPAGRYETVWNGSDAAGNTVASGVYFYRLVAGDFVRTRKMVLLR
jgi:hypothetical protein